MLIALVVLVFNISVHCTGHLGQLVHVQWNDPAGKLKKKLKIDQQPCRSSRLISLASWSNIYLCHILCVILSGIFDSGGIIVNNVRQSNYAAEYFQQHPDPRGGKANKLC